LEITHIGRLDDAAGPPRPNKRKLAVVTTYDELCGIAGFSRCLVRALEPHFDLQVFDLDQFLLRQTDRLGRQKADEHFRSICRQLAKFDVVNLQLEFGTLGALDKDIFRRLRWLCHAARELSVTFHTVPRRDPIDWEAFWSHLRRFRFGKALDRLNPAEKKTVTLTYSILRKYARTKKLSLIVHTRRDRRYLQVIQDFEHVYDHPLSFLQLEDVSRILEEAKRNPFGSIVAVPETHKAIGVFGFLSAYKGFETPIRALRYLPEDYHLYIFGGVHPNDIPQRRTSTYVQKLMKEVTADHTLMDRLLGLPPVEDNELEPNKPKETDAKLPIQLSLESLAHAHDLVKARSDSLVNRVHFIGALSDEEFYAAMASCDLVVLPYHEVMQSSSGPASLSIELGKRTLLSRTRGFLQLGKYFPRRLEYFDVGNHLQLSSLIKDGVTAQQYPERPVSMETLCQMYVGIHSAGEHQLADVEGEAVHEVAAVHAAGNGASSSRPAPIAVLPMDAASLKAAGAGDPTGVDAARQLRRYLRKTLPGSASSKATSDDKPAPN